MARKDFGKSAGVSFVPRFSADGRKEYESEKMARLGKREYYLRKGKAAREARGDFSEDKGLSVGEMEVVRLHRKGVKERTEELRAELELKHAGDWF